MRKTKMLNYSNISGFMLVQDVVGGCGNDYRGKKNKASIENRK